LGRRESLDQIRRILLLAAAPSYQPLLPSPQLEFAFFAPAAAADAPQADLHMLSRRLHELILELVLLIQAESSGLVESPLGRGGRRRLGLGADPQLRLLEEWEGASPAAESPWMQGRPHPNREAAWADALGRARELAESCGLGSARIREIVRRLFPVAARAVAVDDLPGIIVGHERRHGLARTSSGRFAFRLDRDRARGSGTVHTPPELAEELVQVLWDAGGFDPEGDQPEVLDPACGSGQFLLAAARRLAAARSLAIGQRDSSARSTVPADHAARKRPAGGASGSGAEVLEALRHLHGVDIDPLSARIAAWGLAYWAATELRERGACGDGDGDTAGRLLDRAFGTAFPPFLGRQVQVGNSLQVEPSSFSPGFLWERRFPGIFERARPGFDIVVGNPPWVSFGLRDRGAAPEEERRYYERLFPAGTQYKLSLYPIFMELALRLSRAGGVHGFLVPDSVLAGHHFSRIRRLVLSEADPVDLTLIEGALWPGVHVGHTLLYAVRKKRPGASGPVQVRNRILKATPGRFAVAPGAHDLLVPVAAYGASGNAMLRIYRDQGEVEFLSRMQAAPFRLKDVAWTYSGLIARYGQKTIQARGPRAEFRIPGRSGHDQYVDLDAMGHWRPALQGGGEVVPFAIHWRGGHLYWPGPREALASVYKSGFDLARYEGTKVFLRQTGDRLVAAVDRDRLLCLNNLHLVGSRARPGIPPAILAAILLSGPVQRVYRISSLEVSRPLAQVDLEMVGELPYPSDAAGLPIGAGPPPSRSSPAGRRLLRRIERGLEEPASGELVALAASACAAGPAPLEPGGVPGHSAITMLTLELAAVLEREAATISDPDEPVARRVGRRADPSGAGSSRLQPLLDEIAGVFFQIPDGATAGV
jgi:adenine-specific DNA-methyltransferase